jgi:hypothetical protein
MAVAALIVAILALLASIASLAWQVYSWRRSGPHVKVTVSNAIPMFDHGPGEHHIDVTAANRGRAATTVLSWGFSLPGDQSVVVTNASNWSAPLPHRLEPGSEASWSVEAAEIRQVAAEHGLRFSEIVPFVRVAGGARIHAKHGVPLP